MLTVIAFLVALSLLIAIHEYGHYRVAVACGVKVLRFSIGMGRPLWRWTPKGGETEFVIAALPLGGYVKMLDGREGDVPAADAHRAFNHQSLSKRTAIVAAGPLANLALAVVLYAVVNWTGVQQPRALLAQPPSGSIAAQAGLQARDWVQAAQHVDAVGGTSGPLQPVRSFEDLRWHIITATLAQRDVLLHITQPDGHRARQVLLPLAALDARDMDAQLQQRIGILSPWSAPHMGTIMTGSPAEAAGLRSGDVVQRVDGQDIVDAAHLRLLIQSAVDKGNPHIQQWDILRDGAALRLPVTPERIDGPDGTTRGRVGAYIGTAPEMVTVRYGLWEGLTAALQKTWEVSALTLKMIGRMVLGQASLQNLSGPLTIADHAGKSASLGLVQYLVFLALISVSLGVLNLLPLPVLDGGHLLYYLWEAVTGRPVSEWWVQRLQRVGVALLLVMMIIAFFNDINRLWG